MATLIMTAKLNDIDPQAWLADVLAGIADLPQGRLDELLPWNWRSLKQKVDQAAPIGLTGMRSSPNANFAKYKSVHTRAPFSPFFRSGPFWISLDLEFHRK